MAIERYNLENSSKDIWSGYKFGFYITSAKTEKGVFEAFNFIIKELYKKSKALSSELK